MFFSALLAQTQLGGKAEGGALTVFALHPDLAAHHVDQFFADGQSQPGAAVFAGGGGVGLGKGLKQFAGLFFGQPDTGVSDRKF